MLASLAIVGAVILFQPEIYKPAAKVSSGLNLRSAPDTRAERVAVLPVGATVEVQRCLENMKWCNVRFDAQQGWASADYLIARADGKRVRLAEAGEDVGVVVAH